MSHCARKIIGLMSGTSVDGVDAALVEVAGSGTDTRVELIQFVTVGYPNALRKAVLEQCDAETGRVDRLCQMDVLLAERFAQAAEEVCRKAGVPMAKVDLIGSHGQTVHHMPRPQRLFEPEVRATLQIGNPSVIAERTGVTTIADFRSADMAAGGQGAPLMPLVDYLLFRSKRVGRVMLNIGGISNLTVLPAGAGAEEVAAFDTGPGNMVVDALVGVLTRGVQSCDKDASTAVKGKVSDALLEKMMQHPFLSFSPPKSTGRETFGRRFVAQVVAWGKDLAGPDLIRTATAFTARTISTALNRFVLPRWEVEQVVVSGGGTENPLLMQMLKEELSRMQVVTTDGFGIPSAAKEAIGFAVLANETLAGRTGNLPNVTGAKRAKVLGTVAPGSGLTISVAPQAVF